MDGEPTRADERPREDEHGASLLVGVLSDTHRRLDSAVVSLPQPGSASLRRYEWPRPVAVLQIEGGECVAEILELRRG